jgi:membrane protease YdiL (CAAX protease family)
MIKKSVQRLFIVIIIVLAVKILGVVLTKSSPNGILFYQSLTSVLVTLTLIWWVLALLLDLVFIKSKKSRPTAWISLGVLAVIVTIGELFDPDRTGMQPVRQQLLLQSYSQQYLHLLQCGVCQ